MDRGPSVASYNHFNDKLAAIAGFPNPEGVIDAQVGREGMHADRLDEPRGCKPRENVAQETIDQRSASLWRRLKQEQIVKAQEAALEKAGLNPNHFDSEDHIESNITKG